MRPAILLATALLAGCASAQPVAALAALDIASIMVFGRSVADLAVSGISGRDCSIVRLDRRQTYCVPIEPPHPQPYCTRSLGTVDCWADPVLLPAVTPQVGDAAAPTLGQLRYRAAPWPKSLSQ